VLLTIADKKVRKVSETPVGGLAEGIAFSPDGQFVYIANGVEENLVTFRIAGNKLVPEGSPLKLPGHPASMRGSTP
jgi:DNA-binding beta-propeller fold protein YncE